MTALPVFVVCEDGDEYIDRFVRLLGARFQFVQAGSYEEARSAIAAGAAGLLLDLDFRRTPAGALIDEEGEIAAERVDTERRRLAAVQGVLILRALRAAGVGIPALLFADLDDPAQATYLEGNLAPLQVVPSTVGLNEIGAALDRIAVGSAP